MRTAMQQLGLQREATCIIGDRMDTDILAGVYGNINTVLVLSGVTQPEDIDKYAFRPDLVAAGLFELVGP
jgi:NagD protein